MAHQTRSYRRRIYRPSFSRAAYLRVRREQARRIARTFKAMLRD